MSRKALAAVLIPHAGLRIWLISWSQDMQSPLPQTSRSLRWGRAFVTVPTQEMGHTRPASFYFLQGMGNGNGLKLQVRLGVSLDLQIPTCTLGG